MREDYVVYKVIWYTSKEGLKPMWLAVHERIVTKNANKDVIQFLQEYLIDEPHMYLDADGVLSNAYTLGVVNDDAISKDFKDMASKYGYSYCSFNEDGSMILAGERLTDDLPEYRVFEICYDDNREGSDVLRWFALSTKETVFAKAMTLIRGYYLQGQAFHLEERDGCVYTDCVDTLKCMSASWILRTDDNTKVVAEH